MSISFPNSNIAIGDVSVTTDDSSIALNYPRTGVGALSPSILKIPLFQTNVPDGSEFIVDVQSYLTGGGPFRFISGENFLSKILLNGKVICNPQNIDNADVLADSNITSLSGSKTIDGVVVSAGNSVLLTAQTNPVDIGKWFVQVGAWTRPGFGPFNGLHCQIFGGKAYGGTEAYVVDATNDTIGTDPQFWSPPLGGGTITFLFDLSPPNDPPDPPRYFHIDWIVKVSP